MDTLKLKKQGIQNIQNVKKKKKKWGEQLTLPDFQTWDKATLFCLVIAQEDNRNAYLY